jgi:hypothetical protein
MAIGNRKRRISTHNTTLISQHHAQMFVLQNKRKEG